MLSVDAGVLEERSVAFLSPDGGVGLRGGENATSKCITTRKTFKVRRVLHCSGSAVPRGYVDTFL